MTARTKYTDWDIAFALMECYGMLNPKWCPPVKRKKKQSK